MGALRREGKLRSVPEKQTFGDCPVEDLFMSHRRWSTTLKERSESMIEALYSLIESKALHLRRISSVVSRWHIVS